MKALTAIFMLLLLPAVAASANEYKILILNSYHSLMRWGDEVVQGVADEFAMEVESENLYVEHLDTKRWAPGEIFPPFAAYLTRKYADRSVDIVIAADDNALDFMAEYRDRLFPGVPVIYAGINRTQEAVSHFTSPWGAGVIEKPDFHGTIEAARTLLPQLDYIAVVADNTPTADHTLELLQEVIPRFQDSIQFEILRDTPPPALSAQLQGIPDTAAILYISYIRLSSGEQYGYNTGLRLVSELTDAPVFVLWDFLLGQGHALGGSVLRGADQGRAAAQAARGYLASGSLQAARQIDSPRGVLMLDYTATAARRDLLERTESLDVTWVGKPDTVWQQYRLQIITTATLFVSLLIILAIVTYSKTRLNHSHTLLQQSEERWKFALEGSRSGVWDWFIPGDRLYVSPRWYRMLHYADTAWITGNAAAIELIHPQDRGYADAELARLRDGRTRDYELKVRKRCGNGQYRWVLDRGKVVAWDSEKRPLRVIGTQTDIQNTVELQQNLEAGLREKDLLINEIHHRVKNNMQIIASMLSLEMDSGTDYAALVDKTNMRIFAMAAVHEQLYSGHDADRDSSRMRLKEYVFELAQEIRNMQQADIAIAVTMPGEVIQVDLDTAVPLGLILNELISNACEHAFAVPATADPQVLITCQLDSGILRIAVADNGTGFSQSQFESLVQQQKSLGLVLIDSLAQQLSGRVHIDEGYEAGTSFVIEIPVAG